MKNRRQFLQIIIFLALFWTLLALSFGAISYSVASDRDFSVAAAPFFTSNLIKFYLWALLAPLIYVLTKRFPFDGTFPVYISFAVHAVGCVLAAGIHTNIYGLITWAAGISYYTWNSTSANLFQDSIFFGNFYLGMLLYALIVISVQAYLLFAKQQAALTHNAEMRSELVTAQLQALKMQLQPHFLFNALHSISSLNAIDPPQATRMIAKLGEFLRLTLERSDEQMVTLEEEIEFLRYYLEIEQIRFSDRMSVFFDIEDGAAGALVPHLILQPLVENAIKYGIAPFAEPGKIEIAARKKEARLILQIKNNHGTTDERTALKPKSSGTGLKNVRSRLARIYAADFRFDLFVGKSDEMIAEIDLPLTIATDGEIVFA